MLARLGQHSGLDTYPFSNEMPFVTSSAFTVGIAQSVSHRWSSVRISTMLGGGASRVTDATAVGELDPPPSTGSTDTSAQPVRNRRAPHARGSQRRRAMNACVPRAPPLVMLITVS